MGKGISEVTETGRSHGIFFWTQESPAHCKHDTDFSTKGGGPTFLFQLHTLLKPPKFSPSSSHAHCASLDITSSAQPFVPTTLLILLSCTDTFPSVQLHIFIRTLMMS